MIVFFKNLNEYLHKTFVLRFERSSWSKADSGTVTDRGFESGLSGSYLTGSRKWFESVLSGGRYVCFRFRVFDTGFGFLRLWLDGGYMDFGGDFEK